MARHVERLRGAALAALPVALDAMGGDRAPGEIVQGALAARNDDGVDVLLVGPPDQVGDTGGLTLLACTQVIAMDDEPGNAVRTKKDSSLVRAAEAVRDGQACAMVSAGNTGATMASALLRMGRLPGVLRPCIATPLPRPGKHPAVMVDAGANAECTPEMLVQFAKMASAYASARYGNTSPSIGLLSIGEEDSKGTPLVKETHARLAAGEAGPHFVGNVEGRDLLPATADVIVTDGFTGNVALKAMEGSLRFVLESLLGIFNTNEETKAAANVLYPHLLPFAGELDPENTGGAMLLGVDGICIISHGSSKATAVRNAVLIGKELAVAGLITRLEEAIGAASH